MYLFVLLENLNKNLDINEILFFKISYKRGFKLREKIKKKL